MARPKSDLIEKRLHIYIKPDQEANRIKNMEMLIEEYDVTQSEVLRVFLSDYMCNEKLLNQMGFYKK